MFLVAVADHSVIDNSDEDKEVIMKKVGLCLVRLDEGRLSWGDFCLI